MPESFDPLQKKLPLLRLIEAFSSAMDLMSPSVVDHHKKTAYVAARLGHIAGLSGDAMRNLVCAALLHDIGAFSLHERLEFLEFEVCGASRHCEVGHLLVNRFSPLGESANIIRRHHDHWEENSDTGPVSTAAHMLHLADRIAVLSVSDTPILLRTPEIRKRITDQSGRLFMPFAVEAFQELADNCAFWFDLNSPDAPLWKPDHVYDVMPFSWNEMLEAAKIFCGLVDFRSRWTATHTTGVAVLSRIIGGLVGFNEEICLKMEIAGYLHDLGKLGIPLELLEKPGSFSHEDFAVMKRHPYSTYAVLDGIRELEDVKRWGAFHHERLDGSGYPFGLQGRQLDTGSRVLAVADVLTAMSEDRPYRPGLPKNTRVRILTDLARTNQLDSDVIGITLKNFDMLDEARRIAQASASVAYEHLHLVA